MGSEKKRKFIQVVYNCSPNLRQFSKVQNYHSHLPNLAVGLGYETELIIYKYEKKYSNEELSLHPKVKIYYYHGFFSFIYHLFQNRYAFIYANGRVFVSYLCAFFGGPNMFMNHDSVLIKTWWKRIVNNFIQKRFDLIRVINEQEKQILISYGIKEKNVVVLPLPVDFELFKRIRNNKDLKHKYDLPPNKRIILYLANFHPDKDPYTVIDAFEKLLKNRKDVALVLAGKDKMVECGKTSLKDYVESKGVSSEVFLPGYISQSLLPEMYSCADIFVTASISEGQCLSVFEAASCELPLCLSKISSFYPLFEGGALFHEIGDSDTLCNNFNYLLDHKEVSKTMVDKSLSLITEKYSYNIISSNSKRLLKKFISLDH
jgi:glycosyltransferase involved in cell wall biosynthesis